MTYYAGHVPTTPEAIITRWAARTTARNHTRNPPKLTEMKQGEEDVLVLTLSSELATKIQNALSMGRQHRLSAQYTKAKVKELEVERLDNKGLVETLDFELQLKKKELEQALVPSDKQRKELSLLASNLYRTRGNTDVIERNLVKLEEGDKKEMEKWRDAWFEVDRVLDIVWMDAGILKRYETANKERPERTLPPPGIGDNEVDHAMDNFETRRPSSRIMRENHPPQTSGVVETTVSKDDINVKEAIKDEPVLLGERIEVGAEVVHLRYLGNEREGNANTEKVTSTMKECGNMPAKAQTETNIVGTGANADVAHKGTTGISPKLPVVAMRDAKATGDRVQARVIDGNGLGS